MSNFTQPPCRPFYHAAAYRKYTWRRGCRPGNYLSAYPPCRNMSAGYGGVGGVLSKVVTVLQQKRSKHGGFSDDND